MTNGILPATVLEVGPVMAAAMGKDWCRERREVVDYINRFREYVYTLYSDLSLFTDKFYCLEVEKFPVECGHICGCGSNFYHGVTIPEDIDGVMAVWEDNEPLKTYSKWWEARTGIVTGRRCPENAAILMAGTFATQRPLQKPSALNFAASSPSDGGKTVVVKASTERQKRKEYHVTLMGDGVAKIRDKITEIHSVVIPAHLCGTISVIQKDGYELSEYHGYSQVPMFRRLKISTPCPSGKILLQGSLKFLPVYYDQDIVEVGSRLVVEAAARMFRYGESGTDRAELARAAEEEARIKQLLRGAVLRQRGKSTMDANLQFKNPRLASRKLPGY